MIGSGDLGMGIHFTLTDNVDAEGKKIGGAIGSIGGAVDKLGAKTFILNEFNRAFNALTGAMDPFINEFIELDKQVRNIGTLGVDNFMEFKELALQMSKEVPDSASMIAQGAYQAISAGIQGTNKEILEFVGVASRAGVAGLATTESAVDSLTSVLNAYKLEARDSNRISNTFFAAIKLGKTTFPELNSSLYQVIPAASAAKIGFDEVSASIAQMTALGTPTRQSTTQIRQAIIELQKPGKELADVMSQVGLNSSNVLDELANKGLIATLQKVEGAASKMGLSMNQVFSSVEAGSAALLLTGENADRANDTLQRVRDEIEAGAADSAFDVASQSIDVKFRIFMNKVQAGFSSFFNLIGDKGVMMLKTFNQFAPTLMAILPALNLARMGMVMFRKSALMAAISSGGLSAGVGVLTTSFTALATAVWSAMAPLIPFLVAGLALYGVFKFLKNSVGAFNDVLEGNKEPANGFLGLMQKIGGVLTSVRQIWTSWNGETFELSQNMREALERMGMLDFVLNMGTWIVRIKTFLSGMVSGFKEVWSVGKEVFSAVFRAFEPFEGLLDSLGLSIGKNTSDLDRWRETGVLIAKVIGVMLIPVVIWLISLMVSLAVSVIAATWPILLIIGAIVGVIAIFQNWGDIVDWISDKFNQFVGWISSLPSKMLNVGSNIVLGIWKGIKSAWSWFTGLFKDLISSLPFGDKILSWFGVEDTDNPPQNLQNETMDTDLANSVTADRVRSQRNEPTVLSNTTEKVKNITIVHEMDGEEVGRKVFDQMELEQARS